MTQIASHNLIDQRTGQRRASAITLAVQALVERSWCPVAPKEAREAVEAAVRKEEYYFAELQAEKAWVERFRVAWQKRVRELAARHDFDAEALEFEVNRRLGGSFTTTLDGSSERRELYCDALKLALEHHDRAYQPTEGTTP